MPSHTALLFPGQGCYLPGLLESLLPQFPRARAVLDTVDAVAAEAGRGPVSHLLTDPDAPSTVALMEQSPGDLDLVMFASNLAAFEILAARGIEGDVFAGHSWGELSALTAAGAVRVEDATRMVCLRADAFDELPPRKGGMIALSLDLRRATHLLGLLDDPDVAVAVDNGPAQCVLSGPWPALDDIERLASAVGGTAVRLPVAFPFHSRMLRAPGALFSEKTADIPLSSPSTPVYSPILGKYIENTADLRTLVGRSLTGPVMFYDGLLRLYKDGVGRFVESGGRDTLTRLAAAGLPRGVQTVAPFSSRTTAAQSVHQPAAAIDEPAVRGTAAAAAPTGPATLRTSPPATEAGAPAAPTVPSATATATATTAPAPTSPTSPATRETPVSAGTADDVVRNLRSIYAEILDLPEDLLDEDVDLEADLGVDSIKQIEAFDRARRQLGRRRPPDDLRTTAYTTLAELADLLQKLDAADAGDLDEGAVA